MRTSDTSAPQTFSAASVVQYAAAFGFNLSPLIPNLKSRLSDHEIAAKLEIALCGIGHEPNVLRVTAVEVGQDEMRVQEFDGPAQTLTETLEAALRNGSDQGPSPATFHVAEVAIGEEGVVEAAVLLDLGASCPDGRMVLRYGDVGAAGPACVMQAINLIAVEALGRCLRGGANPALARLVTVH